MPTTSPKPTCPCRPRGRSFRRETDVEPAARSPWTDVAGAVGRLEPYWTRVRWHPARCSGWSATAVDVDPRSAVELLRSSYVATPVPIPSAAAQLMVSGPSRRRPWHRAEALIGGAAIVGTCRDDRHGRLARAGTDGRGDRGIAAFRRAEVAGCRACHRSRSSTRSRADPRCSRRSSRRQRRGLNWDGLARDDAIHTGSDDDPVERPGRGGGDDEQVSSTGRSNPSTGGSPVSPRRHRACG